jgi:hypothetical protein
MLKIFLLCLCGLLSPTAKAQLREPSSRTAIAGKKLENSLAQREYFCQITLHYIFTIVPFPTENLNKSQHMPSIQVKKQEGIAGEQNCILSVLVV